MTTYSRGRVVVVEVRFSDLSGTKRRPAVVVSSEEFHRKLPDVVVCPISSRPRYFERPGPGDLPLLHWKKAGLRYPSTARVSKVVSVSKDSISRRLGRIAPPDLRRVEETFREALGL
jgi:mRNA-degrading endonuclease toxin of MazEF toxin-antitoxin module